MLPRVSCGRGLKNATYIRQNLGSANVEQTGVSVMKMKIVLITLLVLFLNHIAQAQSFPPGGGNSVHKPEMSDILALSTDLMREARSGFYQAFSTNPPQPGKVYPAVSVSLQLRINMYAAELRSLEGIGDFSKRPTGAVELREIMWNMVSNIEDIQRQVAVSNPNFQRILKATNQLLVNSYVAYHIWPYCIDNESDIARKDVLIATYRAEIDALMGKILELKDGGRRRNVSIIRRALNDIARKVMDMTENQMAHQAF